ncbi:MAG TPA: hypothetical protein VGH28_00120 [Polyangiaceae bacterium]|jgi:hypothetical protein
MHKHRLDKLAKLTKGAALVGIGAVFACRSESHTMNAPYTVDSTPHVNATVEPVHTNAPPEPQPSASAAVTSSAPAPHPHPTNMPRMNALPRSSQ